MIFGNDWRMIENFSVEHKGTTWDVQANEKGKEGYFVYIYVQGGPDEVEPEFYYSKRNGTPEYPDIQNYCEGFGAAIASEDAVFYVN